MGCKYMSYVWMGWLDGFLRMLYRFFFCGWGVGLLRKGPCLPWSMALLWE